MTGEFVGVMMRTRKRLWTWLLSDLDADLRQIRRTVLDTHPVLPSQRALRGISTASFPSKVREQLH